jgi:hypothetical protein
LIAADQAPLPLDSSLSFANSVICLSKVVKPLASRDWKLYEGKDILELDARGLLLEARCSGLEACCSLLETLA